MLECPTPVAPTVLLAHIPNCERFAYLMRSSNPAFRAVSTDTPPGEIHLTGSVGTRASYMGVGVRALMIMAVAILTAGLLWPVLSMRPELQLPLMAGAFVGSVVCVLVASRVPRIAPAAALAFGAVEGVFLTGATLYAFIQFGTGIIFQAVLITALVFVVMLTLYTTGLLKVTGTFRKVIYAATLSVAVFYGLTLLLALFGYQMPLVFSNSPLGIAFTVVMCILAAAGLAIDFDNATQAVEGGAPASVEWGVAIGLVASVVWLYIEVLRLLTKIYSR